MPQPAPSDVYVNIPLTNVSVAFVQEQTRFIADKVFPNIPVQLQGGRYWQYDRSYWFRAEAQPRGPSSESAGSGWTVDSTPTYFTTLYAVHKDIDDQTRANAMAPLDMDRDATRWVTQQLLLKRELLWQAAYFTTGVWTGTTGGGDQTGVASGPTTNQFLRWDVSGSTPIEDIETQIFHMSENTGYKPNVLVLGPYVFKALKNHAEVLDRIKYTQRGIVTEDILAAVIGVDKVLVPEATQNTAKEGQTMSNSFVYGKAAALYYAAPSPGILVPSAGYTFSWNGYLGAGNAGQRISSFRMEWLKSDRVEGEIAFDMHLVASDLGGFFATAVS